ncbi:MAG: hypothetical protein NT014_01840 [Candidatus Omnitrophica bacterium]|nr:hypothetical protein [Candidatus Omnitrophota bacterium]
MENEYRIYDRNHELGQDKEFIRGLKGLDKLNVYPVQNFTHFSIILQLGFQNINYKSYIRQSDGALFWLTKEHAFKIAEVLDVSLKVLGLEITMPEDNAFDIMADNIVKNVTVEELTIAHKSGDEVSEREAVGLAKLVSGLNVKTFRLWAGEFEPRAIRTFYEKLVKLNNKTLTCIDVCNVSLAEPADRIRDEALEAYVESNKKC